MQITDPELDDPVRHEPPTFVQRGRLGQWRLMFALFPQPAPLKRYDRSLIGREITAELTLARITGGWLR